MVVYRPIFRLLDSTVSWASNNSQHFVTEHDCKALSRLQQVWDPSLQVGIAGWVQQRVTQQI